MGPEGEAEILVLRRPSYPKDVSEMVTHSATITANAGPKAREELPGRPSPGTSPQVQWLRSRLPDQVREKATQWSPNTV